MLRREYKYLVPNKYLDDIRNEMLPFVETDSFASACENNQYTVRSIYYDSPNLDFYHEKIEGLKIRKKLRIRGYNKFMDDSVVFLEIKRKRENFIDKHRSKLYYKNLDDIFYTGDLDSYIIQSDADSIKNAQRFFFHVNKKLLKPISLVVYEREAFFSRFNTNIRITFDKNLRYYSLPLFADLYEDNILKPAIKNHFVFEMKFYQGFPEHFTKIITKFQLIRLAVSKYSICIDADKELRPTSNRKFLALGNPVWKDKISRKEAI